MSYLAKRWFIAGVAPTGGYMQAQCGDVDASANACSILLGMQANMALSKAL